MRNLFKKIVFWIIQTEARIVLKKYKPRIIAVTGSVGKTSAKEAIYTALGSVFYIAKNQKSYNSEIGIPLAIIGRDSGWGSLWKWLKNILEGLALIILPNVYPKWLVVEAGVDHPGDMDFVVNLLKTDIAVFTRLAKTPVHVEFFNSPEDVWKEKKKLVKSLKDEGIIIFNHDDEDLRDLKKIEGKHIVTYGFNEGVDVRASNLEILYREERPFGITFKVSVGGSSLPVSLEGVLGVQHVYPVLSALAVGKALNLNPIKLVESFKGHTPNQGRMRILDGIYGSTIIDDSYNSSPVALEEALRTLSLIKKPSATPESRKIAVLGDMAELGKHTEEEHRKVGKSVLEKVDILVTVGEKARLIADEASKTGVKRERIYVYDNANEAKEFMKNFIKEGDAVLVKGSQSARLEKVVREILTRPDGDRWLLVRQEDEWENR